MFTATTANAAFIVEPNGKASANFAAANTASNSTTAGSATTRRSRPDRRRCLGLRWRRLHLHLHPRPLTATTPSSPPAPSFNTAAGLNASGLTAGGACVYNVYLTYPQSSNQNGMPAIYNVDVDGDGIVDLTSSYDQNVADLNTGLGIGLWELVGQITVTDPSQAITLTITTGTTPGWVGVRTAGVMFEPAVPEPASLALLGLGGLAMLRRR